MKKHDEELERRMVMYLDNAMSDEEAQSFLSEIKQHPEKNKKLKEEESFRAFLKKKINKRSISPSVIQSIKSKIRRE